MQEFADRVQELTVTAGTGTLVLAGPPAGFRAFADAFSAGDKAYCCVEAVVPGQWEVFEGTLLSPSSLSRDRVITSSAGGSPVNFAPGNKRVYATVPSEAIKSDANYRFAQLSPSSTWVINHGLGKCPSVTVVDSAGTQVVGSVVYGSTASLTVSFSVPFSGEAYLN